MSAVFVRGSMVGRGDLDLFTVDNLNQPVNVFEISYAIYDATTGIDVLIGSDTRTPINPDVGEYYAALEIPANARTGLYRIRWRFRETALTAEVIIMEEFTVLENETVNPLSLYSPTVIDMIRRLRILLRDNCISGSEQVSIRVSSAQILNIALSDLWVHQQLFVGKEILSLSPEGVQEWQILEAVHRNAMPREQDLMRIHTSKDTYFDVTSEHRVYLKSLECLPAYLLRVGDILSDGSRIVNMGTLPLPIHVYDVTVAKNHNLILSRSGVTVHNCPDRNYRFRPPTHEDTINRFNRVFGYIWEDYELVEYMERGVDFVNLYPPETQFNTIDIMVMAKPAWRQMILMAAMAHALMAMSINWTSEEFSLAGNELIVVRFDGEEHQLTLKDLYEIVYGLDTTPLKKAFWEGRLEVLSAVTPQDQAWCIVKDVMRHETLHKRMVRVTLEDGRSIECTEDHSLINPDLTPCHAGTLRGGDSIMATSGGQLSSLLVSKVEDIPCQFYTYDLCVPGPENFIVSSGIVAHNSYSIGGISLDISKASQYESLKGNAEQQLDKMLEAKTRTVKIMRGLKQSRYGLGIRSSLGPVLSGGVVSPRKYIGV